MTQDRVVQNFLATMDMNLTIAEQINNLRRYAILYKWESSIRKEIFYGIQMAYMGKNLKTIIEKRKEMLDNLGAK